MAGHEVWNFVNKFYNLYKTGKNASLVLKSHNGKVVINLQLDLDDLILPPPQPPNKSHLSPSRVRRTQRRARARAEAAENATNSSSNNLVAAALAAAPPSPTDTAVIVTDEIINIAEQANYDSRSSKDTIDDVAAKVIKSEVNNEEVDNSEDVDINYNVKVYNPFSPLQMKKELDEPEPASTDYPSSPRQPSSAPSSCGSPSRHSSSSAEPCSPQGTPGTSRINGKKPDTDMSFNLDSKFENMELKLEQMVRNLEKNLENIIEAESKANM